MTSELDTLEVIISEGFTAYMRAGMAFARIRAEKLYKPTYKSFGQYCRERWGMSRTHANRLRQAYETISEMTPNGLQIPASERIVRELVGLPANLTALTLLTAQCTLPEGGHLTYSHVARVRDFLEELGESGAVDIEGKSYAVSDLLTIARPELLQAAYEARARQIQHVMDKRKFDAQKQLVYLTEKASPHELYELAKLLISWLRQHRKEARA